MITQERILELIHKPLEKVFLGFVDKHGDRFVLTKIAGGKYHAYHFPLDDRYPIMFWGGRAFKPKEFFENTDKFCDSKVEAIFTFDGNRNRLQWLLHGGTEWVKDVVQLSPSSAEINGTGVTLNGKYFLFTHKEGSVSMPVEYIQAMKDALVYDLFTSDVYYASIPEKDGASYAIALSSRLNDMGIHPKEVMGFDPYSEHGKHVRLQFKDGEARYSRADPVSTTYSTFSLESLYRSNNRAKKLADIYTIYKKAMKRIEGSEVSPPSLAASKKGYSIGCTHWGLEELEEILSLVK